MKKNEALESLDISNNRIGLLATQKLALGIAAHPNLKVLKVNNILQLRMRARVWFSVVCLFICCLFVLRLGEG